jgi:hypothetical protein
VAARQSVEATDVGLMVVPVGAGCEAAGSYLPALTPGEEFSVLVTVNMRFPMLPAALPVRL